MFDRRHSFYSCLVAGLLLCYLALICGECPGGCSGRGSCGAYDMCNCYKGYMGGDCSQRMCQFGLAHVDTPKGDLDASKRITGTRVNVGVWSNLWPQGTTEQYPAMEDSSGNPLQNTAHEYAECSNKGECDRAIGQCMCIRGYEGSACQRAACPGSEGKYCSGHGVCSTAREIADADHSNAYELWDADVTMGCVCDAGYSGPACEIRNCKQGFDPMFQDLEGSQRYTNVSYVIYSQSPTAHIRGNYSIGFYDSSNKMWKTRPINYGVPCLDVIKALEELPNDVVPYGSVRCTSWTRYNTIPGGDEPIFSKFSKLFGIKYTLAFPKNPGYLRPIKIMRYLDGKRPTMFSNERNDTVGIYVYPNGFIGENVEYFTDKCLGVELTLRLQPAVMDGQDSISEYSYLSDLTLLEQRLLQRCLGDGDGMDKIQSATGRIEGQDYTWDFGTVFNPHLVRMVVTSPRSNVVTDLCDRFTDQAITNGSQIAIDSSVPAEDGGRSGNRGRTCTYAAPNAGFYAALYFDPVVNRYRLMNRASKDYGPTTKFAVWTTQGHVQMVSDHANVYSRWETDEMYSRTLYTNNGSSYSGIKFPGYSGNIDCETHPESRDGAFTCLAKGDSVFFLDTDREDRNPEYLNMYKTTRVYTELNAQVQQKFSRKHRIELNYAINSDFSDPNSTWHVRAFKFFPPASQGYTYVSECSNRGICRTGLGLCECFSSYTLDDCSSINNFATAL